MVINKISHLESQQLTIAAWAVKTAMVLNAAVRGKHGERINYYSFSECSRLRKSWEIPTRTFVWLGRFLGSNLGAWSSGLLTHYPDDPGRYRVQVSTILMGSLVIQVLSGRIPDKHRNAAVQIFCTQGPWNDILIRAWPCASPRLYWPPLSRLTRAEPFWTSKHFRRGGDWARNDRSATLALSGLDKACFFFKIAVLSYTEMGYLPSRFYP